MKTYRVTMSHFKNVKDTVVRDYETETIFDATKEARKEFKGTPYIVDRAELVNGPGRETLTCRKHKA